jgi:hypothetical protein
VSSNYQPSIPTVGQYPNAFTLIFTVLLPYTRQPSPLGYPYPHPPNYEDSRLHPINQVTEPNIGKETPPSYELFINQNRTISVCRSLEKPVSSASVYQNLHNMNTIKTNTMTNTAAYLSRMRMLAYFSRMRMCRFYAYANSYTYDFISFHTHTRV